MKRRKITLLNGLILLFLIQSNLAFSGEEDYTFDTSNDFLMNATILGAIASFGFSCYQGKAPCSLSPDVDTNKLTFSVDIGADNSIKHTRLALGADWLEDIYNGKNLNISGRMEINTSLWTSSLKHPENKSGFVIGIHPVFRYASPQVFSNVYLELGAGPQLLSDTVIENENKSILFQFANILGFGYDGKKFEIGYRYLHISNANIKTPNPGTDFHNLHFAYHF